jgi:hypothetical protein
MGAVSELKARLSALAVTTRVACGLELWDRRHLVCAFLASAPKFSACVLSFDLSILTGRFASADSVMRDAI